MPHTTEDQNAAAGSAAPCEKPDAATDSKITASTSSTDAKDPKDESLRPIHFVMLIQLLCVGLSVTATETTVTPALPLIAREYRSMQNWVPWTLTAVNIVGGIWTAIAGSLADIYGIRWVFVGSLCVYLVGQLGCAFSTTLPMLIAFRALQGFGLGIYSLCYSTVRQFFPKRWVPMCLGVVSAMFAVGTSAGLVAGAALIEALERWRWEYVFFCFMPITVALIVSLAFTVPNQRKPSGRRVDFIGAPVLAIAISLFLAGLSLSESRGWKDPAVLCCLCIGIVLMPVFLVIENYVYDPLISLRIFFQRDLLCVGVASFAQGFSQYAMNQSLPYLYELKFGLTNQILTGLCMLPTGFGQLFVAPIASIVGKKVGFARIVVLFLGIASVGFALYSGLHNNITESVIMNVIYAIGMGGVNVCMNNVISEHTKPETYGSATGTNLLLKILGGGIGPICTDLILFSGATHELTSGSDEIAVQIPTDAGYRNSFLLTFASIFLAFIVSQFLSNVYPCCSKPGPAVEHEAEPKAPQDAGGAEDITVVSVVALPDTMAEAHTNERINNKLHPSVTLDTFAHSAE
eukprot:m51a1_g3941 hypothetical protein (575) ;mRNA; f:265724-267566